MKTAQLIKVTETELYKNAAGDVLELTPTEKLLHILTSPNLVISYKTEEIIERWSYKTKKEIDKRFWDFIENNNLNANNYYIVF